MVGKVLAQLIEKNKENLAHFWQQLDTATAEQMLQRFLHCEGSLIFSGVGKSGLVAKKIALTMTSTGSKAAYLCPLNALHGDIGMLGPKDIFIMLSKSGESEELLNLVPFLHHRSIPIIAWVSSSSSCRLARAADDYIVLPVKQELCPFDLVPTTSAAVQMLFGDMLAIALMSQREFSLDQYALNHPAGRIGRRISLKVKDLMVKGEELPLCSAEQPLTETIVELSKKKCGCILITDEQRQQLMGIFTDGDLRRALQRYGPTVLSLPMQQLMNSQPRTIAAEALAWEAMRAMEASQQQPINVLPVTCAECPSKLVGLIKMHDLVQSGL